MPVTKLVAAQFTDRHRFSLLCVSNLEIHTRRKPGSIRSAGLESDDESVLFHSMPIKS
jgi:hypothetical protein